MIRRLFWLLTGAGLGISCYRRVTRVLRGLAGSSGRSRPREPRGLAGFARDVRNGMDLYAQEQRLNIERRRAPAGPTLDMQQVTAASAGYQASHNGSAAPRAQH
jgi:hypothetical protein